MELFVEQFKTFLVKERGWSITKAYNFQDVRVEEAYKKGLSVEDAFFEILTGSGND